MLILQPIYLTLVHPTLDYASVVWDPPFRTNEVSKLEKIQRRNARFNYVEVYIGTLIRLLIYYLN